MAKDVTKLGSYPGLSGGPPCHHRILPATDTLRDGERL